METTTKLEQLKQQLAAKTATRKLEIAESIEERKLETKIQMIDSPAFETREIAKNNMLTLQAIQESIEEISSDVVIYRQFGLGAQINKLLGLVKTAMFAKAIHRDEVQSVFGIDEDILEDIIDALGNSAYFKPEEMIMVDEVMPDIPVLKELLMLVAEELGLTDLPLKKISKAVFEKQYKFNLAKQTALMEETVKYANEHGIKYTV